MECTTDGTNSFTVMLFCALMMARTYFCAFTQNIVYARLEPMISRNHFGSNQRYAVTLLVRPVTILAQTMAQDSPERNIFCLATRHTQQKHSTKHNTTHSKNTAHKTRIQPHNSVTKTQHKNRAHFSVAIFAQVTFWIKNSTTLTQKPLGKM